MHLNPESLSFALLISDLGSIARAANILGMKQATLSRKLATLESRVGVRLFDRSTRGVVPTVSGAGFLNQARRKPTKLANFGDQATRLSGMRRVRERARVATRKISLTPAGYTLR